MLYKFKGTQGQLFKLLNEILGERLSAAKKVANPKVKGSRNIFYKIKKLKPFNIIRSSWNIKPEMKVEKVHLHIRGGYG